MAITSDGKPSTPDLVIKSGDAELTNWIDMEVENHLHLPDTFTVRLLLEDSRERPFATMDEVVKDFLEEGRQVEISRREDSRDRVLICGEVTSVSLDLDSPGPGACDSVVLHGFDRSHRMHRTRKTRVFNQWSFKEVVKTIAEEAKLKAVFDQEDRLLASGGDYLLIQENQTNWEFLWQLADQVGYEVFVEEGILFFQRPDNERRDTVELTWGEDLSQFRARASTASQFSAVTVQGWDQKNNEVIRGTADQGEGSPRLGDARPGTDQAKNAFGESPVVVNRPVHSGADADKMAQSLANDIAGEFVIAEGATTRGMADIKPGVTLRIGDIGHRMSGDYYVTSATHRYTNEEGYTTSFVVSGRRHYTLTDLLQPGAPTKGAALAWEGLWWAWLPTTEMKRIWAGSGYNSPGWMTQR